MFSQEVVSKFSDASEQPAVVSNDRGGDWDTAERYYSNGGFRCIAAVAETDPVERVANTGRGEDTPAVFISTMVQAQPPQERPEPTPTPMPATVDRADSPAIGPADSLTEPVATLPQDATDTPQDESSSFDALFQGDASADVETDIEAELASEMDSDPQPEHGEIDVLPLPLGAPTQGMAGFGVFSDETDASESGSPQTSGGAAAERQYTQADVYGIPSGQAMRYVDPSVLVRQQAVERAENRRRRIEARKWMGYDPLRPSVTAVPYTTVPTSHPALIVIPFVVRGDQ